jgi:poly(A) polymerase
LQKLNEGGYSAYIVGGSVRDFLLGQGSKDHDIATHATPDEICRLFPQAITVGKVFGVIKVPTGTHPPLLEIATFRQDLDYKDYRHPKGVVFSNPIQDAQRRDFTINGLFYDPKTSQILDAVGGVEDLKSRTLRAIGNPSERFREDALRLLRAIRFKTKLDFELDPETSEAIRFRARLITKVSTERIRDELNLMWLGPRPAESLSLLSEFDLLRTILPEIEALKGIPQIPSIHPKEDLWTHLLKMLHYLSEHHSHRTIWLAWAILLHDVSKPEIARTNPGKNFNGYEVESSKMAEQITARLKMSKTDCHRISTLVANHLKFKDVFQMRESTLQRFIRQPYFDEWLAFHRVDAATSDGNLAYYEFCNSRYEAFRRSPNLEIEKLVDGKDLIQLGFQPGPEFANILGIIEDLVLEKKLRSKEEALEYIVRNFVK